MPSGENLVDRIGKMLRLIELDATVFDSGDAYLGSASVLAERNQSGRWKIEGYEDDEFACDEDCPIQIELGDDLSDEEDVIAVNFNLHTTIRVPGIVGLGTNHPVKIVVQLKLVPTADDDG